MGWDQNLKYIYPSIITSHYTMHAPCSHVTPKMWFGIFFLCTVEIMVIIVACIFGGVLLLECSFCERFSVFQTVWPSIKSREMRRRDIILEEISSAEHLRKFAGVLVPGNISRQFLPTTTEEEGLPTTTYRWNSFIAQFFWRCGSLTSKSKQVTLIKSFYFLSLFLWISTDAHIMLYCVGW